MRSLDAGATGAAHSGTEHLIVGLQQFVNAIMRIARNPNINHRRAVARHLAWQVRKALGLFPFDQTFSKSRIRAFSRTCGVSALIYSQGLYDFNNMNLLAWLLRDGGVFFDVGANVGPYSLLASEQPTAQVFAFEPHPRTFQQLTENIKLNGRTNITAVEVALGDRSGHATLTQQPQSSVNHLTTDATAGIPVQCMRADAFCAASGVLPSYVKIDVEGFEHSVLLGFGDVLHQIDALFIEINGLSELRDRGEREIHRLLTAHEFRGPYKCDFKPRTLAHARSYSREDSVYLSPHCAERLVQDGYRLSDQASRTART